MMMWRKHFAGTIEVGRSCVETRICAEELVANMELVDD